MGKGSDYYQQLLNAEKLQPRNALHSFHRYFGKFIPAIPSFAIQEFTKPGDNVLDIFCGSGTTILEAKLHDRNGFGVDINPLAIMAATAKTQYIEPAELQLAYESLLQSLEADTVDYTGAPQPYCVNIDHWFRPEVKHELLKLRTHILNIQNDDIRLFFLMVFSAFMRNVSNADPRHVFPGYSKRLRQLDAEGKRRINVMSSFESAAKKRMKYLTGLPKNHATTTLFNASSRKLPPEVKDISLAVINPPYISSIRYLETMKIEMGWLDVIHNQQEYFELDKLVIGTERFYKKDLSEISTTLQLSGFQEILDSLVKTHPKMAKVVAEYFVGMQEALYELVRVLKPGGHIVIKISDSTVRGTTIPTHQYFQEILAAKGMKTIASFRDDFDPNSRSLMTSRNSYSGIMTYDWVLIFEK